MLVSVFGEPAVTGLKRAQEARSISRYENMGTRTTIPSVSFVIGVIAGVCGLGVW